MGTKLSVNVNKVALLRNQRDLNTPSVVALARAAVEAGAHGVTLHPRPDERHIRPHDVDDIAQLLADMREADPSVRAELNIEGNPFEGAMLDHCSRVRPTQATLVPDSPDQYTSDHGWPLASGFSEMSRLQDIIAELQELGCRVSLFMDADDAAVGLAPHTGCDRVELYTQPWAEAYGTPEQDTVLRRFAAAAARARDTGLKVNAGHDLNLANLAAFLKIPNIEEVSIGHALTADALEMGWSPAVRAYLDVIHEPRTE